MTAQDRRIETNAVVIKALIGHEMIGEVSMPSEGEAVDGDGVVVEDV